MAAEPRADDEPRYVQAVQSYGMQAGSRSSHLNMELYPIPQVPHWVAEEIGGGARYVIKTRTCVWCSLARSEEEAGERLVLAEERFVVFTPAASRSRVRADDRAASTCRRLHHARRRRPRGHGRHPATDARRARRAGRPPYNLFLHTAPVGERLDETFHWHWELHPRLRVIAGLERATALAVNPAAPEYAAGPAARAPHHGERVTGAEPWAVQSTDGAGTYRRFVRWHLPPAP